MLHVFQPAPFPDPARQRLFDAVRRTLHEGLPAEAPAVLAGPLPLPDGHVADAVLLRPHSLTLLLLLPAAGGELRIPSFVEQPWQLDGQPVRLADEAVNPYQAFARLQPAVLQVLAPLLPPETVNPRFVTGLWITEYPLRFGPGVEASMSAAPEAQRLQLLPELARLPRRLAQLATPEIELTAADLHQLAAALPTAFAALAPEPAAHRPAEEAATLGSVVQNTARQLWRWLGAEDIDTLPADSYELAARGEDRKHELEEQQALLQRQLSEQIRAIEAREAAREASMAQLRIELAQAQQQAAPNTQELQARLAAESQAHTEAEAQRHHSEQEWQRRNQDLDTKISALEQLIQRLQAPAPDPAPPRPTPAPQAPPTGPTTAPPTTRPPHVAVPVPPPPTPAAATAPAPAQPARTAVSPPTAAPAWQVAAHAWFRRARQWVQARLPAPDHWGWLAAAGLGGLGLMIWLSTQAFRYRSPEAYQADGKWGFVQGGEPVVPARYTSVQPFQDERAVVEHNGAFGAVDDAGQELVPLVYDAMNNFSDGYARVRIGDAYTFVDAAGQELNRYFYNAYDFAEGYAPVLDQRGWFYLNASDIDAAATPRIFQEAYPFHDGLARVRTGGTYTFITPACLTDADCQPEEFGRYEQASDFADGRARVQQKGRRFVIDRTGAEVTE